eukprot:snap_masked-scaffold248_size238799-processed-gene-0.8 protein:Tk02150 transcript:snap_masked-scaffold248_size238799-processed-gene-0.8-mRNA-1 annotation:"hypothetical protein L798_05970"
MFSSENKAGAFYPRSSEDSSTSKSSYYVWFLGSKESRGLRGPEYIRPVVHYLLERNADIKLTLQVSGKGLKIVQTPEKIKRRSISVPISHSDGIKQFVPHSSITSVYQSEAPNDDVVSCILLLSTPGTDCPLFVHSYRCDSSETAAHLKGQLQALIEKPENLAKYDEIEGKLVEKGLLAGPSRGNDKFKRTGSSSSKIGSDGRSLGRSSDSGGSELNPNAPVHPDKLVTLYDSLAAELREKLNSKGKHAPLLLPPRDYDTMHRSKGNLSHIEARKALNPAIVGETNLRSGSDHSSGIGSGGNSSPLRDSPPQMERFSSVRTARRHEALHLAKDKEINPIPLCFVLSQ